MAVSVVGAGLIPARFSLSYRQKISRKSATAHSPNRYKQAEEKRQRHNDNEIFAALRQRKMKMPTHKTAHLQAPTHKPMLQLAKEQFSC
jgi:hypothetical protein